MKLIRFALGFAFGTLLSRVLGFLRDAGIAYYFGASSVSDAFFIAFRIPNSFRRLLGEGGFNAAFVPLYTRSLEEGREREFLGRVFSLYLIANGVLTFTGILLSDLIVTLLAPGLRGTETFSLAVFMARFLFLYLLLVGLSAFFMGVLNVRGRFFVPAASQAVFNAVFLMVLMLLADSFGYGALIAGVLVGGICQVAVNVPSLIGSGVRFSLSLGFDERVKLLLKRLVPALGGFGVNQLSFLIDTVLASFLRTGAISYLYYANRLYQLPFGVVSVGVANSLLSVLSRSDANRGSEVTTAFRLIVLLTLPASAGLFLLSGEIVEVIYRRGSFLGTDAEVTAKVLSLYSLGLLPYSLQKVLSAEFFSRGDTATPVKVSLATVLSEGVLGASLAFAAGLGIYGLPLGTALASLVGLGLLLSRTRVRISLRELVDTTLRSLLATLLMGGVVLLARDTLQAPLPAVLISIPLAVLTYLVCLSVFREPLTLSLLQSLVEKLRNP